jgi:hypothetical protein
MRRGLKLAAALLLLVAGVEAVAVEERGASVGWTGLGYAGASNRAVVAGHPGVGPAWLRPVCRAGLDVLERRTDPGEPRGHAAAP